MIKIEVNASSKGFTQKVNSTKVTYEKRKRSWWPTMMTTMLLSFSFYYVIAQNNLTIEELGETYELPSEKLWKGLYFHFPADEVPNRIPWFGKYPQRSEIIKIK